MVGLDHKRITSYLFQFYMTDEFFPNYLIPMGKHDEPRVFIRIDMQGTHHFPHQHLRVDEVVFIVMHGR